MLSKLRAKRHVEALDGDGEDEIEQWHWERIDSDGYPHDIWRWVILAAFIGFIGLILLSMMLTGHACAVLGLALLVFRFATIVIMPLVLIGVLLANRSKKLIFGLLAAWIVCLVLLVVTAPLSPS